ncbi:hypothetical protein JOF53_000028 [Crossiella equi]|uniref:Uncharacterized protein n=1 Tax=Crossiella equi TaxID=130796 RepID=A0ABS5A3J7_9PSEU|nr:hypothetical protein [Crossiella equi]MBP2471156.1 hypothetical protein [Crossiella equi]
MSQPEWFFRWDAGQQHEAEQLAAAEAESSRDAADLAHTQAARGADEADAEFRVMIHETEVPGDPLFDGAYGQEHDFDFGDGVNGF